MWGMRLAPVLLLAAAALGCPPAPHCPDRNDAKETPEEAALTKQGKDACTRAGERLAALKCKEARKDFVEFCRHMLSQDQPICPTKLARIQSCAEIEGICR